MSAEENKALVRRYYEAYNTGDSRAFDTMFALGYVLHISGSTSRPESGSQLHARTAAWARASLPDLHYEVRDLLTDGEKVVDRTSVSGTLRGELRTRYGTFPPTGQRLTWTEISIHRFEGGKIAEQWWETDWAGIPMQLGALPVPAAS